MEEITEVKLNTWYIREWDNAFFCCQKIDDKFVEGNGFINDEFDVFLHFERPEFENEWKTALDDEVQDYFDSKSKITHMNNALKQIISKSIICVNKPGYKQEFFVDSVSVTIGIGDEYVADLVMTKDAWEELNKNIDCASFG